MTSSRRHRFLLEHSAATVMSNKYWHPFGQIGPPRNEMNLHTTASGRPTVERQDTCKNVRVGTNKQHRQIHTQEAIMFSARTRLLPHCEVLK